MSSPPNTPLHMPPASNLPAIAAPVRGRSVAVRVAPARRPPAKRIFATVIVLGVLTAVAAPALCRRLQRGRSEPVTHTVHYEHLRRTIVGRGELESARSADVYCRVKAGTRNSTVATTIRWVIDEGTQVRKGDLLADLDDSGLREQLKEQRITLDKAAADKVVAEENFKIVVSQNESDIKTAETILQLARIDLRKYVEGDYPQALDDLAGRTRIAESDLGRQRERVVWACRMLRKGFQTVSQTQAEQARLDSLETALLRLWEEKRVLTDPGCGLRRRTVTELAGKVAEAQRALNRARAQALARETQASVDRAVKRFIHSHELAHCRETEEEIRRCRITSPQDGMVVYAIPEQARRGGAQQAIVAQGEPVREGQRLMHIPDLHHTVVTVPIHEAIVSRIRKGERATIHVTAFPDRPLAGHVLDVAALSYQLSSYTDPVFNTTVAIDDDLEGLQPGMTAEVALDAGDGDRPVMTVPLTALVGSVGDGSHRRCYVLTPDGVAERGVAVGRCDEEMAEVREGLAEGEQVVVDAGAPARAEFP